MAYLQMYAAEHRTPPLPLVALLGGSPELQREVADFYIMNYRPPLVFHGAASSEPLEQYLERAFGRPTSGRGNGTGATLRTPLGRMARFSRLLTPLRLRPCPGPKTPKPLLPGPVPGILKVNRVASGLKVRSGPAVTRPS
jgi:hypothetical protein